MSALSEAGCTTVLNSLCLTLSTQRMLPRSYGKALTSFSRGLHQNQDRREP